MDPNPYQPSAYRTANQQRERTPGLLHKVDPANRNSQLETALDLASFEPIALETRCLVFEKASLLRRNLKTVGLFEKKLAGWVAGFITVCLQPRWLGQKTWVLIAGSTLSAVRRP